MKKWQKITVLSVNIGLGLFIAYMSLVYVRETSISANQDHIVCDIINLNLEHSSRSHPTAHVIYRNKKYSVQIPNDYNLQIGYNDNTFYYDELLDRVFLPDSRLKYALYLGGFFFACSFLFWLDKDVNDKNKKH